MLTSEEDRQESMLKMISQLLLATVSTAPILAGAANAGRQNVTINWSDTVVTSKTHTTLQSVANPLLLDTSPIRNEALQSLSLVSSDYVRYVPWYPYPKLAVPELDPPVIGNGHCKTSWNFTYADQLLGDFLRATPGKKHIINFSTTPTWMWTLDSPYTYPQDPSAIDFNYNNGTQLRDPSCRELADYYKRILSWYVQGGFTDECGVYHRSGHHWDIEYWEILNEMEHNIQPDLYNKIYDAVTAAIAEVSPATQFVGLALISRNTTFLEGFLRPENHRKGVPLDWISYHFYATPSNDTTQNEAAQAWTATDTFITEVQQMEAVRKSLSPNTKTTVNEIGTMDPLGATTIYPDYTIPPEYWLWSGGIYAYIFSKLAELGIDVVGESQLVGYPGQYPSVSMVDWATGKPNARLRVLQLLQQSFAPGDVLVATSVSDESSMHSQAFQGKGRRVLLVNKVDQSQNVHISGLSEGIASIIDLSTEGMAPRQVRVQSGSLTLPAYAVAVLSEH